MPPTFSVLIPTYNQADLLKSALDSVMNQTFLDFEVILVNNYSTDHTLEVASSFKDSRLRVIDFKNNGVIGASRNKAIEASHGDYVAFLDSDDTWYDNKLDRVAQAIQEDLQAGLFCHNQVLLRDGRVVRRSRLGPHPRFNGDMFRQVLFGGNGPSTSATVVARKYLLDVGSFSEDPALITVEDTDLWLRLARVCRFQFIDDVLGTFRLHTSSLSADVDLHLRAGLALMEKYCGGLPGGLKSRESGYPWRLVRRQYANLYYGAARQLQVKGEIRRTWAYYWRALQLYPVHARAYAGMALAAATALSWPGAVCQRALRLLKQGTRSGA